MNPLEPQLRTIDTGATIQLVDPPPGTEALAFHVITLTCKNPECTCTRMPLRIGAVRRNADGKFVTQPPILDAEVSSDGTALSFSEDPTGTFSMEIVAWFRDRLSTGDYPAILAERWRRGRGQIGDPAFPSGFVPEGIEGMVRFHEVFPYEFDLVVEYADRRFLVDDYYCMESACTCTEMLVEVRDTTNDEELGHIHASVRRPRNRHQTGTNDARRMPATFEGSELLRPVWNAFLEKRGASFFEKRFERMRSVAKERRREPSRQTTTGDSEESSESLAHVGGRARAELNHVRVGRNDPCPCGSGKKFKRCCA